MAPKSASANYIASLIFVAVLYGVAWLLSFIPIGINKDQWFAFLVAFTFALTLGRGA